MSPNEVGCSGNTLASGLGTEYRFLIDNAGHLQIDIISAGLVLEEWNYGWTQPAGDDALANVPFGTPDGINFYEFNINANGDLAVNITDPGTGTQVQVQASWNLGAGLDQNALTCISGIMGRNLANTGTVVVRCIDTQVDNIVNTTNSLVVSSFLYGLDSGANWDRIRSDPTNADNLLVDSVGALRTASYLFGFDGINWDRLRIDTVHAVLASIGFEHYEVHLGHMFILSDVRLVPGVGPNELFYHIRDVGGATTDEMHANISIVSDGAVEITIYENPTLTDDGAALTAHNKDRHTGGAPGTTFFHTPTITNNGTEIYNNIIPSATHPTMAAGGKTKGINEWIFDSGDAYLIRILGAGGENIGIEVEFYEA